MKRTIARESLRRKKKIARRLAKAARQADNGPVLTPHHTDYEVSKRVGAIAQGGIGLVHKMVSSIGLVGNLNRLSLLKQHKPYYESDHILNLAYNLLCGGRTLDDIELRRNDENHLNALGVMSIPDPTTAGDFCRRFKESHIQKLLQVINEARLQVWQNSSAPALKDTARIDIDGTTVETLGERKEGVDMDYKGRWGYLVQLVTLANTQEVLDLHVRPGNRPSHEGAADHWQKAIELARKGGFKNILLRGDTAYSLTEHLDALDDDNVKFVFGYNAMPSLVLQAEVDPDDGPRELVLKANEIKKTKQRAKAPRIKEQIVRQRGFKNLVLKEEHILEFGYRPKKCAKNYRIVAVRKDIDLMRGQEVIEGLERYFFYITNDWKMSAEQVVTEAHQRCNQENVIEQLKNGTSSLRAPLRNLNSNWAYMVACTLAWNLKSWLALSLPTSPRWASRHEQERSRLLTMDFRTFLNAMILIPAQVVRTSRKIVLRFLSWNPWLTTFWRLHHELKS